MAFEQVFSTVLSHETCDTDLYFLNGWDSSIFFIRPASEFDVRQHLKVEAEPEQGHVAVFLQTDHPDIVGEIIDKVAVRTLVKNDSEIDPIQLYLKLDVTDHADLHSVSMGLDVRGEIGWGGFNLITGTSVFTQGGRRILQCCISKTLLILVDVIGKKYVKKAVRDGLVLHLPEKFFSELRQEPKRCSGLRVASESVTESFSFARLEESGITAFNLFQHVDKINYRRGNL
ncbi:hypothetical protein THUN1379_21070 [Paludibacterium sp. THUN1379]|nr:hypothetical protein THUN1379_21070 [Paludibacterium sp. THUN1379]